MVRLSDFNNNTVVCPQCLNRDFHTTTLEAIYQPFENGEWGEEVPGEVFLLGVECIHCGYAPVDITIQILTLVETAMAEFREIE